VTLWNSEPCDLLIAVHAKKSAASVLAHAAAHPHAPVAVLLAGTDVYPRFDPDPETLRVLERANTLIALQPRAAEVLPVAMRDKVRTIVQSATAIPMQRSVDTFTACVLAHLRPVKDPLLPFEAASWVPADVPLRVVVAGRAIVPELAEAARRAVAADARCQWSGELSRREAKRLLASSHVCIVPSSSEGGANVVSEALAAGTPILATRIPGNTGLLGNNWPGLFAAGNAKELGDLLTRAATDSAFYQTMVECTQALQHLVDPARERESLRQLVAELVPSGRGSR